MSGRDLVELINKNKYSKTTVKFIALYLTQFKLGALRGKYMHLPSSPSCQRVKIVLYNFSH